MDIIVFPIPQDKDKHIKKFEKHTDTALTVSLSGNRERENDREYVTCL